MTLIGPKKEILDSFQMCVVMFVRVISKTENGDRSSCKCGKLFFTTKLWAKLKGCEV